jgi:methionyl aminopeptidase
MIIVKTAEQIECMRKSGKITAFVLKNIEEAIKPGVTTLYLNEMAEDLVHQAGATPSFKGYRGFPYSICSSRNNEIVHGFPSDKPLEEGEILSVDFGANLNGWHGDSAFTKAVGEVPEEIEKLLETTEACLYAGILRARAFNRVGDISNKIETLANENRFDVIKEFVGHGIGRNLHEEPSIPNYGRPHTGYMLKPGMIVAIEPMLVECCNSAIVLSDGWTTVTGDSGMSAHFEHTILITNNGPEILTDRRNLTI